VLSRARPADQPVHPGIGKWRVDSRAVKLDPLKRAQCRAILHFHEQRLFNSFRIQLQKLRFPSRVETCCDHLLPRNVIPTFALHANLQCRHQIKRFAILPERNLWRGRPRCLQNALRRRCATVASRLELSASALVLLEVACHADAALEDLGVKAYDLSRESTGLIGHGTYADAPQAVRTIGAQITEQRPQDANVQAVLGEKPVDSKIMAVPLAPLAEPSSPAANPPLGAVSPR